MNYYFKLFLLAAGVGFVNIIIYIFFLQFQIVHNSSYVPQQLVTVVIILIAIPIQFFILLLIAFLFKRKKEALYITSGLLIITCFLILWFTSQEERATFSNELVYNKTEKYDYQQGISTPEGYPIKLLSESIFDVAVKGDQNPHTLLETDKVYSIQWGLGDTTFKSSASGDIVLPYRLKLYWYSYLENKYYGLDSKIDKNKIATYFRKGFPWDINGTLTNAESIKKTYDKLFAGIAPGGEVVLFISGFDHTKEIEVFKGKEISVSKFKDYDTVTEEGKLKVLTDTCTCADNVQYRKSVHNGKPIPYGIWTQKYRQKFNWKLAVNSFGQTKSALNLYFYNGERSTFYNEDVLKINYQKQVLPEVIKFIFIKNNKKHEAFLEFEEDELFQNFKNLTKINANEPVSIVLNIDHNLDKASVQLRSKNELFDLKKMKKVRIYSKTGS